MRCKCERASVTRHEARADALIESFTDAYTECLHLLWPEVAQRIASSGAAWHRIHGTLFWQGFAVVSTARVDVLVIVRARCTVQKE